MSSALVVIGVPLIAFKAGLPGWLEAGAEKAIGVVILVLAARVIYKWARGDYRPPPTRTTTGTATRRHLRRATAHRHVKVRTRGQASASACSTGWRAPVRSCCC